MVLESTPNTALPYTFVSIQFNFQNEGVIEGIKIVNFL